MNTNNDSPDTLAPATEILQTPSDGPSQSDSPLSSAGHARATGKIARLPKSLRDQVNQWILDGVTYSDIIERLGDHGKALKPDSLSQWRKRGHQDWLLEQSWLAETRARQESASNLSTDFDASQINHAALQLATLQMFEALRDVSSPRRADATESSAQDNQAESADQPEKRHSKSTLDMRLGGDSSAFVRLIHALARASRETLLVQKYRDACSQARLALQELKDPNRELNESETRAIVRKVDEILGLAAASQDKGAWSLQRRPGSSALTPETVPPCPPPAERVFENSNETPREGTRPTGNSRLRPEL